MVKSRGPYTPSNASDITVFSCCFLLVVVLILMFDRWSWGQNNRVTDSPDPDAGQAPDRRGMTVGHLGEENEKSRPQGRLFSVGPAGAGSQAPRHAASGCYRTWDCAALAAFAALALAAF